MEAEKKALNVLHITDCHLTQAPDGGLLGMNTRESFFATLDHIDRQPHKPDYILVTGDLSQDGSQHSYQVLQDALSRYDCPISWFPGNHDSRSHMSAVAGTTGELEKVRNIGGWKFVLLDSLNPGKVSGYLEAGELSILKQALGADQKNTMVCLHHHPVDIGSAWLDNIGLKNRDEFMACVESNAQVKSVLWGHIHQDYHELLDGKLMLASPSTCIQFKPKSKDFALDTIAPGYRWLMLGDDGSIDTHVVRVDDFSYTLDMTSDGY